VPKSVCVKGDFGHSRSSQHHNFIPLTRYYDVFVTNSIIQSVTLFCQTNIKYIRQQEHNASIAGHQRMFIVY